MFFTSESVTEGHPDKICDRIADSILDAILSKDSNARVACEVAVTKGLVHVFGEISTNCYVEIENIARRAIAEVGYNNSESGFDGNSCGMILSIGSQSNDIAIGVDKSLENKDGKQEFENKFGAGDQGVMFGFACRETPELMPLPISLAHKLARRLTYVRKEKILPYLLPDGKTQVTAEYHNGIPRRIETVVISAQHMNEISIEKIRKDLVENVINFAIPQNIMDNNTKVFINPTGRFVIGGPSSDSGLTGRKLMVDTYGCFAHHGGGAFSGKDPTKVDRSAAYMARYVAKTVVSSGAADKCEIQVSYAIGVANPISISVDTFGTSHFDEKHILKSIKSIFDFRPASIIKNFNLCLPIYTSFSSYGHFGREDLYAPWEKNDKTEEFFSCLKGD
ncbi:MAG: methionine adenosyltransferase [Oscillospiraceae bacterium]|nr:methionine adenosyltransferase [Oscillospiraceae bacterium]